MATRKDVAKRAGVSTAVVSYVLNNSNYVKKETRERVLRAIEELGYRPNVTARSLKTRKSQQIGVLVNQLGNPFEAGILLRIEEQAHAAGYIVFFQSFRDALEEKLESLFHGRVDGLILLGQSLQSRTIERLQAMNIAMLSIMTPAEEHPHITVLDLDWVAEMRKLLQHLKSRGHQRIGFMTNGSPAHPHEHRYRCFLQAARLEGLEGAEHYTLYGQGTLQQAREQMNIALRRGYPCSAIICANDLMAAGVVAACRDQKVDIPGSLAVAGCEDILMSSHTWPPLTTIHYPRSDLGRLAMDHMLNLMKNAESAVKSVVLKGSLNIRDST